jgi:hypothetical protein
MDRRVRREYSRGTDRCDTTVLLMHWHCWDRHWLEGCAGVKVMYNLTVAQDHTLTVDSGQWAILNNHPPMTSNPLSLARLDNLHRLVAGVEADERDDLLKYGVAQQVAAE